MSPDLLERMARRAAAARARSEDATNLRAGFLALNFEPIEQPSAPAALSGARDDDGGDESALTERVEGGGGEEEDCALPTLSGAWDTAGDDGGVMDDLAGGMDELLSGGLREEEEDAPAGEIGEDGEEEVSARPALTGAQRRRRGALGSSSPVRAVSRPPRKKARRSDRLAAPAGVHFVIRKEDRGPAKAAVDIPSVSDVKFLLPSGVEVTRSSGSAVEMLEEHWRTRVLKGKKFKDLAKTWIKGFRPDHCLLCHAARAKPANCNPGKARTACGTCVKQRRPCIQGTDKSVLPLVVLPEKGTKDDTAFAYFCPAA